MRKASIVWVVLLGSLFAAAAQAKPKHKPKPAPEPAAADDDEDAEEAAQGKPDGEPEWKPVAGPKQIDLGHDVVMELPAGFLYLDPPQAKKLMERNGNLWNDDLLGVVASQQEASWLVTIRYTEDGYVKDDEAEKLDAKEIFKAIKEGTDEANKERQQRGFDPLHVLGWSESPRYERARHHMVWALRAKTDKEPEESINFNTRVLGRKGYVALNLIDGASSIEAAKPAAATLLAATTFKTGARYEDFNAKTDKVAEYGLAALVLGGAGLGALKLVKVGLLAKFGAKILALLFALKKAIVLLVMGALAFLKRLFGGKKASATAGVAVDPATGSPVVASPAVTVAPAPVAVDPASGVEQHPSERHPRGQGGT
jgi:uncharacterized membrane-anchored protein